MEKNILELKVNNKDKNLESYLKPQWSWKTLISIVLFCSILVFIVKDLEIDFIKLVSDSSKYFGDILSRMLPPDFSNLNELIYAMFETIEIAFLGTFIAIGFGAMPGVLALGLHTMGFLAKFYAEDIEHINKGPIDALKSSGATKSQIISFGVIPQILPSFVANNL